MLEKKDFTFKFILKIIIEKEEEVLNFIKKNNILKNLEEKRNNNSKEQKNLQIIKKKSHSNLKDLKIENDQATDIINKTEYNDSHNINQSISNNINGNNKIVREIEDCLIKKEVSFLLKNKDLINEIGKKLKLYYLKNVDLFSHSNFEFEKNFFAKIMQLKTNKKNEQKEKYIFLKIYKFLEEEIMEIILNSNIESDKKKVLFKRKLKKKLKKKNSIFMKKNKEFFFIFNKIYFDDEKYKNSNFRIYNPKNKKFRFNHEFVRDIFKNDFFKKKTCLIINNPKFHKFIKQDIKKKIDLMIQNIFVHFLKFNSIDSYSQFFNSLKKSKIPWNYSEILLCTNTFYKNFIFE